MRKAPIVMLALLACQREPAEAPAKVAVQITEEVCRQAEQGLNAARDKVGLIFRDDGTASVEQALWFEMGEAAQKGVIKALAVRASCVAPVPLAQVSVEVKNEAGFSLAGESVDLSQHPSAVDATMGGDEI